MMTISRSPGGTVVNLTRASLERFSSHVSAPERESPQTPATTNVVSSKTPRRSFFRVRGLYVAPSLMEDRCPETRLERLALAPRPVDKCLQVCDAGIE